MNRLFERFVVVAVVATLLLFVYVQVWILKVILDMMDFIWIEKSEKKQEKMK